MGAEGQFTRRTRAVTGLLPIVCAERRTPSPLKLCKIFQTKILGLDLTMHVSCQTPRKQEARPMAGLPFLYRFRISGLSRRGRGNRFAERSVPQLRGAPGRSGVLETR